jgi:hypothetical protein
MHIMSGVNGDKSRFNRERKQKIRRRQRTRALLKNVAKNPKSGTAATAARKTKEIA